jgi:hypothetical protein
MVHHGEAYDTLITVGDTASDHPRGSEADGKPRLAPVRVDLLEQPVFDWIRDAIYNGRAGAS